jgi:hypothetical protein
MFYCRGFEEKIFLYYILKKTKVMDNRIERWMKRNNLQALYRKMLEWNTQSVNEFFKAQFESNLTKKEKSWVEYLQSEYDERNWY